MSLGRLVVRSSIRQDESLTGLISRLADYNDLDSPRHILRHVGLTPGFEKSATDLTRLAEFIGSDVQSLNFASFASLNGKSTELSFSGARLSRSHLNTLGDRTCPLCLRSANYARRLWHLRAYVACHEHGVLLTDTCCRCEQPLSPLRRTLLECPCGEPLQVGPEAGDHELRLSSMIAAAAEGTSPLPLKDGHLNGLCALTWYFGLAGHIDDTERRNAWRGPASVEMATEITRRGAPFAYDWRPTFLAWAETRFTTHAGVGIHRYFGRELSRLRIAFQDTCPFVLDELRSYLTTTWPGFMLRRSSFFCTAPVKPRFVTVSDASKLLGVSSQSIRKCVTDGLVSAIEGPASARRYLAIRADGLETLRRYLAGLLSAEQAGLELGISARRVGDLARAGYLRRVLQVNKKPRFDAAELRRFCESLASPSDPPAELIRLTSTKSVRFTELVRRIREGQLAAWFGPDMKAGFDNLFIAKSAIEEIKRGDHPSVQFVSTFRVCDRLQLDNRTLASFVQALSLQARWRGHHLIAVGEAATHEWQDRLTTSGRIGSPLGLSGAAVSRRLKQLGIVPILPSNSEQKISAVWLVADVEGVDFSTQWATAGGRLCRPAKGGRMRLADTRVGMTIGPDSISLSELQRSTRIGRMTLSLLAREGFLAPGGMTSRGHLRGVTKASAELFDRTYVSSTAIGARHGLSAISVTRRILAAGMKPLLEGHSTARYQFCWQRTDVEAIDFKCLPKNVHGRRHNAPKPEYMDLARSPADDASAVVTRIALNYLGTNAASLRAAIDRGLLSAARTSGKGSVVAVYAAQVRRFAEEYGYTPKLSSELGISEIALSKTLSLRGATPVIAGRAPIQALWRRAELDLTDILGFNANPASPQPSSADLPF